MPRRLFLVDGSHHAFRVMFALPPQHASDGFPTRVLYGFTLLFQKLMRQWQPDFVAVAFDSGKTFRHELYPAYKGHRPDMPDELRQQWPWLPKLVEGFGYAVVSSPGFEADDVLGTLAVAHGGPDTEVLLVTADKDFAQLVSPYVRILDEAKGAVLGEAEVQARWGVGPSAIADLLALSGDSSDAIPGVAGIGDKTAAQLLAKYGTLDEVLAAAARGEVPGKRGETLAASREVAHLSRRLATIRTDVPGLPDLPGLLPTGLQADVLRPLFERWEFGMVARKLLPSVDAVDSAGFRVVRTASDLAAAVADARAVGRIAVAPRFSSGRLTDVAWWTGSHTWWVPVLARPGTQLDDAEVRGAVAQLLGDASIAKVAFDLKGVARRLAAEGWPWAGGAGDPGLLDYVLVAHRRTHGLEDLAQRHLGHTLGYVPDPEPWDVEVLGRAACEPACVAGLVERRLLDRLDEGTRHVYDELELPLVPVLGRMEARGIRLDLAALAEVRRDVAKRAQEAEARCHELAGHAFKVGSPQAVSAVLFDELGLPPTKKLPSGGWSTDSASLEGLDHVLPSAILEYRQLQKLEGTYLARLPEYVGADGRIHTDFQQTVAATGRLSSVDPNLQNIPVRTHEGRRIRHCFVPAEGHRFVSCDYSQIELRLLAHITGCRTLLDAFRLGQDIHRRTASEVFHTPIEAVTNELRTAAKAINFGLLYGMSAFRLARDLGIGRSEANAYIEAYFARLPEVSQFIESTRARAQAEGGVRTLYGRRRLLPEITSKNFQERAQAEREAVNTIIQGTAADVIKRAMIRVDSALDGRYLTLQVHDELLFEVPVGEVDRVGRVVRAAMEGVADLSVPLDVTVAVGDTWANAHA